MTLRVFITGASSGIGEALAVYYAEQGANLGLVARRAEFLESLNQRLGGQHACYALDVSDASALHVAAGDFIDRFGAPVAELVDGRVALLEFKGAHLMNDPYELEKRQVGELWARTSSARSVFGWLTFEGLAQQLDAVLA